ncbi:LON peptidase substrate-binding domain-containing protein [Candidatus Bathyarchaeota archaeon]|nr:LON peptidase substrate-binding domain-containing protein [Candidatus Bathyarchaeota archaeon]
MATPHADEPSGPPTPSSPHDSDFNIPASLTPRQLIRLFQCRRCSLPLRAPVALPCGESICKTCQPPAHPREGVSFPGTPERLLGFECPFRECGVEHALADCAGDVVLESVLVRGREELEKHAGWHDMKEGGGCGLGAFGEALLADYALVKSGDLEYDDASLEPILEETEPTDAQEPVLVGGPAPSRQNTPDTDGNSSALLLAIAAAMRPEADCNVCYALFHDPVTTACGHTYCRSCLHRSLDIHPSCPICRRTLSAHTYHRRSSSPSNARLTLVISSLWPIQAQSRSPPRATECDTPIFVCTVSLPTMPTVLHVFETRYRLMVQRALQGDRTFGMVLPLGRKARDGMPFTEVGTMLRIKNLRMFPDGRSLLEAVGVSRFRVVRYEVLDDYVVAKVERYDDVSIAEEEAIEAAETRGTVAPFTPPPPSDSPPSYESTFSPPHSTTTHPETPPSPPPLSYDEIDNLPTATLLSYARLTSATKLRRPQHPARPAPDDPALFAWWLASALPTQESAKYRLLRAVSVRERLKLCCRWLVELDEGGIRNGEEGYVFPWVLVHSLVVVASVVFLWAWGAGADGL